MTASPRSPRVVNTLYRTLKAPSIEHLEALAAKIVREHESNIQSILSEDTLNFSTTFERFHHAEGRAALPCAELVIPGMTSDDKQVRSTANNLVKKLRTFWDGVYSRQDIYSQFKACAQQLDMSSLSPEQRRLVDRTLTEFRRATQCNSPDLADSVAELQASERSLMQDYQTNVAEDASAVSLTPADLDGCPSDFVQSLPSDPACADQVLVGTKAPQILPVLKYAKSGDTRRRVLQTRWSIASANNADVLQELVNTRHEKAVAMGYPNHAAYILEPKMAKDPKTVETFLLDTYKRITTHLDDDLKVLQQEKDNELGSSSTPIQAWDVSYYARLAKEKRFSLDELKIKEYFPLTVVMDRVLSMYENILHVRFTRITDHPSIWHPDVFMYEARDTCEGEPVIGWFFLDLFPRMGKYSHQCVVPIQASCVVPDTQTGEPLRFLPAAAFIGNLTPPSPNKPSLMTHSEVRTFFHELGHVMHCLCTRSTYSIFSWSWSIQPYKAGVEYDFLEAPSQMLENWIWDVSILQEISQHYQDPSQRLPTDMATALCQSRKWMNGYGLARQIMMSLYDLYLHTQAKKTATGEVVSPAQLFHDLHEEFTHLPSLPDTHYGASFIHLVTGYDAGYYGYLWSEVYSHDMFTIFSTAGGCTDAIAGRKYRECILEPGATQDGSEMLTRLLGRAPSTEAFHAFLQSDE